MKINEVMKATIKEHRNKIELTQWAIYAGVSSLVYSEFIRRIKNRTVPVRLVMIPEIKTVLEVLNPDGDFLQRQVSGNLIDMMISSPLFDEYKHAPELVLFREENVEILKTILDLYMIPSMGRHVAETIAKKFRLGDPDQQLIREDHTIDLFERQLINEDYFQFVVDQCVLQLLILIPTMKKQVELPEDNSRILLGKDEILTVNNDNAICPIHFNKNIINNKTAMDLLSFATSTNVNIYDLSSMDACAVRPNGMTVNFSINSSPFNYTILTTFEGISDNDTQPE